MRRVTRDIMNSVLCALSSSSCDCWARCNKFLTARGSLKLTLTSTAFIFRILFQVLGVKKGWGFLSNIFLQIFYSVSDVALSSENFSENFCVRYCITTLKDRDHRSLEKIDSGQGRVHFAYESDQALISIPFDDINSRIEVSGNGSWPPHARNIESVISRGASSRRYYLPDGSKLYYNPRAV